MVYSAAIYWGILATVVVIGVVVALVLVLGGTKAANATVTPSVTATSEEVVALSTTTTTRFDCSTLNLPTEEGPNLIDLPGTSGTLSVLRSKNGRVLRPADANGYYVRSATHEWSARKDLGYSVKAFSLDGSYCTAVQSGNVLIFKMNSNDTYEFKQNVALAETTTSTFFLHDNSLGVISVSDKLDVYKIAAVEDTWTFHHQLLAPPTSVTLNPPSNYNVSEIFQGGLLIQAAGSVDYSNYTALHSYIQSANGVYEYKQTLGNDENAAYPSISTYTPYARIDGSIVVSTRYSTSTERRVSNVWVRQDDDTFVDLPDAATPVLSGIVSAGMFSDSYFAATNYLETILYPLDATNGIDADNTVTLDYGNIALKRGDVPKSAYGNKYTLTYTNSDFDALYEINMNCSSIVT